MSKNDKIRVLEKLSFEPGKYRKQQLLTFIRQGRFHYELREHEDSKVRREVARRCEQQALAGMIVPGQMHEVLNIICERGTKDQLTKILELDMGCAPAVLKRGFPEHVEIILDNNPDEGVCKLIAQTSDNESHLAALLDHESYEVREIIAKRGNKKLLDYLLSDDCALVRCAVADRGFIDHLEVLQYDDDCFRDEVYGIAYNQSRLYGKSTTALEYEISDHKYGRTEPRELARSLLAEKKKQKEKEAEEKAAQEVLPPMDDDGKILVPEKKYAWLLNSKKGKIICLGVSFLILSIPVIYHIINKG